MPGRYQVLLLGVCRMFSITLPTTGVLHTLALFSAGRGKHSQPKISDFRIPVFIQQDVLTFDIPVENLVKKKREFSFQTETLFSSENFLIPPIRQTTTMLHVIYLIQKYTPS
jgi:hypothetical protein